MGNPKSQHLEQVGTVPGITMPLSSVGRQGDTHCSTSKLRVCPSLFRSLFRISRTGAMFKCRNLGGAAGVFGDLYTGNALGRLRNVPSTKKILEQRAAANHVSQNGQEILRS